MLVSCRFSVWTTRYLPIDLVFTCL